MRIGLITPGFCASEEDWCIPALSDLVRVLAERDEVTVFALRYPDRRRAYAVHGATVHATGGAQRGGLARLPILLRTLARILRQSRRQSFDVFCALWAHEPGFVAVLAGRLTGTPVLVSILGGELIDLPDVGYGGGRSRVNRWLVARALAAADGVTVGSQTLRRLAARQVKPEKLHLHPLGVDTERFTPALSKERRDTAHGARRLAGDPRILSVASLTPVKDHRLLLAAFAIVARRLPGARLHLVGSGPLRTAIVEAARELGIAERVELHGEIDHGELAALYRQADLLVVSSRFEAQGMVALEAAACGCLVAGTPVGVLPEICPPAALAQPGDAASLAAVVESALAGPRRGRRSEARAEAVRGFELRPAVGRLQQRFEALIRARGEGVGREATD